MFIENAKSKGSAAHILDIAATALAISGYKILDGDKDTLIIRHVGADAGECNFEIDVNEVPG